MTLEAREKAVLLGVSGIVLLLGGIALWFDGGARLAACCESSTLQPGISLEQWLGGGFCLVGFVALVVGTPMVLLRARRDG